MATHTKKKPAEGWAWPVFFCFSRPAPVERVAHAGHVERRPAEPQRLQPALDAGQQPQRAGQLLDGGQLADLRLLEVRDGLHRRTPSAGMQPCTHVWAG